MSVAAELQNIVADLSASIAGRKVLGRADQEKLRRQLTNAASELRKQEAAGTVSRLILTDLITAVETGAADIAGAAAHARARAAVAQSASAHS